MLHKYAPCDAVCFSLIRYFPDSACHTRALATLPVDVVHAMVTTTPFMSHVLSLCENPHAYNRTGKRVTSASWKSKL